MGEGRDSQVRSRTRGAGRPAFGFAVDIQDLEQDLGAGVIALRRLIEPSGRTRLVARNTPPEGIHLAQLVLRVHIAFARRFAVKLRRIGGVLSDAYPTLITQTPRGEVMHIAGTIDLLEGGELLRPCGRHRDHHSGSERQRQGIPTSQSHRRTVGETCQGSAISAGLPPRRSGKARVSWQKPGPLPNSPVLPLLSDPGGDLAPIRYAVPAAQLLLGRNRPAQFTLQRLTKST